MHVVIWWSHVAIACRCAPAGAEASLVKIATWNVNGIRARHAQLQDLHRARAARRRCACRRSRPRPRSAAGWLCELEGYWCYWHGDKGYSGVALARVAQATVARAARVSPSRVRLREPHRHRARLAGSLTVASIYVPNGGKDFAGQDALPRRARRVRRRATRRTGTPLVLCGDLNVARTDMDVHPEGAEAAHDRPASRGAGADRAHHRPRARRRARGRSIPTTTTCSRGGRRGGTCGSGTSAGGSTTSWRAARWQTARSRASCSARSAAAITAP